MNPIEKVVQLAKTGDKRVLAVGAVAVGGGIGLFVYLRKRGQGSDNPTANNFGPTDQGNGLADYAGGGGTGDSGGGGGGSDIGGIGDLGLGDMLGGTAPGDLGLPVLSDSYSPTPVDTSSPM